MSDKTTSLIVTGVVIVVLIIFKLYQILRGNNEY